MAGKAFSTPPPIYRLANLPDALLSRRDQMLVISDEVYKYMVYEGLGAGGDDGPTTIGPEAAAAALQAAKSATTPPLNGGINSSSSVGGDRSPGRVVQQPESEGWSSAAREAPPTAVAKKADDVGVVEPLPALRHVHFATLPGMWDRTITISSAGKTFSVTGWQVRVVCYCNGAAVVSFFFRRLALVFRERSRLRV